MSIECRREPDVLDALAAGWPARADADLRAHVAACPLCADLVVTAQALREAFDEAWQDACVPSSAHTWWRAQLRARQEAARAAARPLGLARLAAELGALATIGVLLLVAWTIVGPLFTRFESIWFEPDALPLGAFLAEHGVLIGVALAAWLIAAPVALYFVWSD
jgi:hypothetical protein